jgi:hypothetical protein
MVQSCSVGRDGPGSSQGWPRLPLQTCSIRIVISRKRYLFTIPPRPMLDVPIFSPKFGDLGPKSLTIWQPWFPTARPGNIDFGGDSRCPRCVLCILSTIGNKKPDSAENLFPPPSLGCIQLTDLLPPLGIHLSQLIQRSTDSVATPVTTV